MCWYEPPEESKKLIKECCEKIISEIKYLDRRGDAYGCTLKDIHTLLDHLYHPETCKEQNEEIHTTTCNDAVDFATGSKA
jgi:hypothetical protein